MNPDETVDDAVPVRPSWPRRFAAGAWHVPGGVLWLLRHPRLWPLALLPALLGAAGLGGGLVLGIYAVPKVEAVTAAHRLHLPDLVDLASVVGLWAGTLGSGIFAAVALAFLSCAPLLDLLGRRADALDGGTAPTRWPRWRELPLTYARALPLLAAVPVAFVLCLVPFVGPLGAGLVVAVVVSAQQTAPALAVRGQARAARRAWRREWRPEILGFGITALLLLPVAAPLLVPALAVGAALLVHEIEGDVPVAEAAITPPVAPAAEATPAADVATEAADASSSLRGAP